MKERNEKKAKLVYDYLDQSTFYKAHSDKENRSLMNVTLQHQIKIRCEVC